MPTIDVRGLYTLIVDKHNEKGSHLFEVQAGGQQATVSIDYSDNAVTALIPGYHIADHTLSELRQRNTHLLDEYPEGAQVEISTMRRALVEASREVASLIKYHLGHARISEQLIASRGCAWLQDGSWRDLPSKFHVAVEGRSVPPLSETYAMMIQASLQSDLRPLLAMRHLHRARNETIAHHKWIDATIAAELAIKEILIRAKPDLEELLLEVPSPPLSKLYGPIMQHYLGERSPYLPVIAKGVERRNALVHKPHTERVDDQEAINYVSDIEAAILHALRRVYPEDQLLKAWEMRVRRPGGTGQKPYKSAPKGS